MVNIVERFIRLQLEESPESEKFLRNLILRGVITKETMRNYCIVKQFDDYLKANKGFIADAMIDLEDDFGVCDRTIRRVHRRYTKIY